MFNWLSRLTIYGKQPQTPAFSEWLKRRAPTIGGASAVLAASIAGISLLFPDSPVAEQPAPSEPLRPVPPATVLASDATPLRSFPGKVRGARRVELGFSVSGRIDGMHAPEGANVRRGEILAQLDQRDFRLALDKARPAWNMRREPWNGPVPCTRGASSRPPATTKPGKNATSLRRRNARARKPWKTRSCGPPSTG